MTAELQGDNVGKRRPWFPFYTDDWLSSIKVRQMTHEARSVYVDLLAHAWQDDGHPGSIPDDDEILAVIFGAVSNFAKVKARVLAPWVLVDGRWYNPKLLALFVELEDKSRAGKASAESRWGNTPDNSLHNTTDNTSGNSPSNTPSNITRNKTMLLQISDLRLQNTDIEISDMGGEYEGAANLAAGSTTTSKSDSQSQPTSTTSPETKPPARKRATEFPSTLALGGKLAEYADAKGLTVTEAATEWESFEAYHRARGSKFLSWPAAWRTWCLNWVKFKVKAEKVPANMKRQLKAGRHSNGPPVHKMTDATEFPARILLALAVKARNDGKTLTPPEVAILEDEGIPTSLEPRPETIILAHPNAPIDQAKSKDGQVPESSEASVESVSDESGRSTGSPKTRTSESVGVSGD